LYTVVKRLDRTFNAGILFFSPTRIWQSLCYWQLL
jgi:hypothetical protein